MRTAAIVPVKDFEQAKQRLAPAIQQGHRRALVEAMLADAMIALRRTKAIDDVFVVTVDRAAGRIATGDGAEVVEDTGHNHSEAAELGIAHATAVGATRVLLVPGDCPLIDPAQLDALLERPSSGRSALIIPDRHGDGTNGLLLSPPDALTPSFGDGSRQRHVDLAIAQGSAPEVLEVSSLGLDIDTPEDLQELINLLGATRGGAAYTRGFLNQLLRTQAG
jgi:2-phospho-L-lactate/phosphoenolpyruvate guanylyltransferase